MKNGNKYSRRGFLKSSGIIFGSTLSLLFLQPIITLFQHCASRMDDYKTKQTARLIRDNQKFIQRIAESYMGQGLSQSKLVKLGNEGLIKAAKHYDNTRGYPFISYAVWWIRQAMLQGLAERATIVSNLKTYSPTTLT